MGEIEGLTTNEIAEEAFRWGQSTADRVEREIWNKLCEEQKARAETAEKKLAEMRSIVEWMEWKGCWEYGEFCPECGRTPLIEHQRSCSIRKALGR